jgi:hypothetical protein
LTLRAGVTIVIGVNSPPLYWLWVAVFVAILAALVLLVLAAPRRRARVRVPARGARASRRPPG